MANGKIIIIGFISIMILIAGFLFINNTNSPVQTSPTIIESTPIQNAINQVLENGTQNAIKQAVANGTLSVKDMEEPPEYSVQILERNESHVKLITTTKLILKNPRGAGLSDNKWPKFQIITANGNLSLINETNGNISSINETSGNLSSINETNGNMTTEIIDYDQQIKDSILSEIKNINNDTERTEILDSWNNYSFDSGQRTYEINETYDIIYSNDSIRMLAAGNNSTYDSDILMGFTENIHWKYSKEENYKIWIFKVAWFKAYAELSAALGLRLPTTVSLDIPNQMNSGQSYTMNTKINGTDWDADKYSAANVPPENGNEFVARGKISLSAQAWTIVTGNIGPYRMNKELDYGKSFKTPFGPDEKFPIPELILSPEQTGLKFYAYYNQLWAGIGLKIEPILGSDKITAKWNAGGDSIGNGSIEYRLANNNYNFGPLKAGDYDNRTNYAKVNLSDYNYYFSICKLDFDANVQAGLTSTLIPIKIQSPYIVIYSYNCNNLLRRFGITKFGIHNGTNANSVNKYIMVVPKIVNFELNPGTLVLCDITCRETTATLKNIGDDAHNVYVTLNINNSIGDIVYSTQKLVGNISGGQSKSEKIIINADCGIAYLKCLLHMPLTLKFEVISDEGKFQFPDQQFSIGQTDPSTGTATPEITQTSVQPNITPTTVQPTTPITISVEIKDFAFNPSTITIPKGTTILWRQIDYEKHTVTGSGFNSPELSKDHTFSHTFNEDGTYEYQCSLHPSMRGKVIVTASVTSSPTPTPTITSTQTVTPTPTPTPTIQIPNVN